MPSLHPEGWYNLEIKENGISEASTGTHSVFLVFKPVNPEYPDLVRDLWLTEAAIERTVETLREIGYQGDKFEDLKNDPTLMAGIVCRVQVFHDDYTRQDGTTVQTARVGWVNNPNRRFRQMAESVPQNMTRFNAILKQKPKVELGAPVEPSTVAAEDLPAPNGGDVPF
jgi:hypothetical protein